MSDFGDFDFHNGDAVINVAGYGRAIASLLRTYPGEIADKPDVGFPVLEKVGDVVRSRSGLSVADVITATEEAILRFVPGIVIAGIEPEMTAQGGVNAIDIGFTVVAGGHEGKIRVEII